MLTIIRPHIQWDRQGGNVRPRIVSFVAAVTLLGGLLAVPSVTATAATPPWTVVASGLNNPRQMSFGPHGNLYVAEAGSGKVGASDQSGGCFPGPEGEICAGNTSSVTRIRDPRHDPETRRVQTGLLSFGGATDGSAAIGLDAVSLKGDKVYGIVTWGPPNVLPRSVAAQNGQLVSFSRHGGKVKLVADIGAFSLSHLLPGREPDSNPYGVLATDDDVYVVDAANNTLLEVDDGRIKVVATFETRAADGSGFDGVPTSIARHDGKLYVGQLSSFEPGKAKITVFTESGKRLKTYEGLSSVTSVAVAKNGDIYATEIFAGAPFASEGALVKIPHDGGPRVTTPLPTPGGVAVDRRGNVYVSINSVEVGTGQVIRINR
jgi:hypothetical protein